MKEELIIGDKAFQEKVRNEIISENKKISELVRFGSCEFCPIRDYCTKKKFLSKNEQKKGCEDVRNLYLENVKQWRRPGRLLIRNAAEIRTRILMQSMKDGHDNIIGSKDWQKLMELELKYAKQIMRYESNQDRTVKYETIDVEMEIPLEEDKYNSPSTAVVPDYDIHGNITPETIERHNQRVEEKIKEAKKDGLQTKTENDEKRNDAEEENAEIKKESPILD